MTRIFSCCTYASRSRKVAASLESLSFGSLVIRFFAGYYRRNKEKRPEYQSLGITGGEEVEEQLVKDIGLFEVDGMACARDDGHARVWYESFRDCHERDGHDLVILATDEQHRSRQGG